MIEEIYLVSPNIKYKETYIAGVKELQEYVKLNLNDVSARETAEMSATQNDIEELERDFENFVSILLDKEKPYEERMSLYDKAPDNVKKLLSPEQKAVFQSRKTKPGADFWIIKKDEKGTEKYIGEISIRPSLLDQKDLTHGARKYEPWSEELGNVYGVETASFLLPSERGGGKMDKARVDFFKKLKQKGINEIVATVNRDNNPSIKKQRELRDVCGGREYFRVVNEFSKSKNGKTLNSVRKCVKNRFIIKVDPEIFEKYLAKKLEKFKQYNIENRAIFEKDICR